MSYNYESFNHSPQDYCAELTSQSHQTLYWLNRNGYLDNESTEHLLKHMVVVPLKNNPKFGQRLIERFFGKKSSENAYVFPITLLDEKEMYGSPDLGGDRPTLKVVK